VPILPGVRRDSRRRRGRGRERESGGYYLVSDGTVGGDVGAVERSLERRQTVVDVDDADGDVD